MERLPIQSAKAIHATHPYAFFRHGNGAEAPTDGRYPLQRGRAVTVLHHETPGGGHEHPVVEKGDVVHFACRADRLHGAKGSIGCGLRAGR